jgi:hypothetical protein
MINNSEVSTIKEKPRKQQRYRAGKGYFELRN